MSISCDAETPGKNSAKQYSELTQAIVEIRKEAQKQASSLATVMSQAFGVFKTEEAQEDGSIIYYMHDKPTLEESMCIWKFTADAFAVSTDGGEHWNAGLDASGNATVNILSAIGINCDWIHAGTLTLGGYNNQNGRMVMRNAEGDEIGCWDKDGVYALGSYTCDSKSGRNRIKIADGTIYVTDKNGNTKCTISTREFDGKNILSIENNESSWMTMGTDDIGITASGDVSLTGEKLWLAGEAGLLINGREAKTGAAEFSDGSELRFHNGILIGGYTVKGGQF